MRGNERHLESLVGNTFFVSGSEPLQIGEFCDLLRARAKDSGIEERLLFEVSGKDCWLGVEVEVGSLSLFASTRLIEIQLSSGMLKDGLDTIRKILERSNNDVYLIKTGEISYKDKRSRWYSVLSKGAVMINFEPPSIGQLPLWILDRFALFGKKISREAAGLIAEKTEGNLVATAQEVEKLALQIDSENVTLDKVIGSVLNGAKFSIYDFRDSLLEGDVSKSLKVIQSLKNAGIEPLVINWIIRKEFRDLVQVSLRREDGESLKGVFSSLRIWGGRIEPFKKALNRGDSDSWLELLVETANIGFIIKGVSEGNPWERLALLTIKSCGVRSN